MPAQTTKKAQKKSQRKSTKYVVIDYPKENEVITHPNYTIRIDSSDNSIVEVSIDGGGWQSCRYADDGSGAFYWWFDWSNYSVGEHKIVARIRNDKGRTLKKSEIRTCTAAIQIKKRVYRVYRVKLIARNKLNERNKLPVPSVVQR